MRERCPASKAIGLGRIQTWNFIVNKRGYCNIVRDGEGDYNYWETSNNNGSRSRSNNNNNNDEDKDEDEDDDDDDSNNNNIVYGVLYQLGSFEEKKRLDRYEGVPTAYEDLVLPVEFLDREGNVVGTVWALCYIDRKRKTVGPPKEEYIKRMDRGIKEAHMEWGLPLTYIRNVMSRYLPVGGIS